MITQIRSQIKESSTGIIISIVAFMLWPLGAFISSIKYAGTRIFSVLMVSFYFLYGYTYIIAGKDQDNFRIAKYFTEWSGLTFDALWSKIITLYELGNKPDLFQDFLQFTVSRFTNNVQVYFAVTATLFGLVAAALFKVVLTTDSKIKRNDFFLVCVTLFLLLVLSPGRINSFRHYFGVAIFTYSLYRYLNGEGFKYLFLLMLTPFIHFAFVMIIPLVLIQKLISNRLYIYYLLIVISFFLSGSVADYWGDFTRSIDESSLQYQAKQYTSEAYLQKVDELKTKRTYILDIYTYATTVYFLFVVVYLAWMTRIKDRT
ncbi:MAG: EpsG family protein, partial [Chryseotalea sp.]